MSLFVWKFSGFLSSVGSSKGRKLQNSSDVFRVAWKVQPGQCHGDGSSTLASQEEVVCLMSFSSLWSVPKKCPFPMFLCWTCYSWYAQATPGACLWQWQLQWYVTGQIQIPHKLKELGLSISKRVLVFLLQIYSSSPKKLILSMQIALLCP